MSMIAYSDILGGRIPIYFLFAALVLGFAFGLRNDRWVVSILGCLSNLALGSILYWFGIKYTIMRIQKHPNIIAFGIGDTYGARAIGALVGLHLAVCGLLITLILVVLYTLALSVLEKRALTSMPGKLGSGYLLAAIVLFFFF